MEVDTPGRLHFGLLHVPGQPLAEGPEVTSQVRSFGGAGLTIAEPALRLEGRLADAWSAAGPHAEQIMAYAMACRRTLGESTCQPLAFLCKTAPPRHAGFGSGTQMGLAVAKLIAEMNGRNNCPIEELALWIGRGKRSAIGAYGFAEGGFLVEAGKRSDGELSTLVSRHTFPESWPIVIVLSHGGPAIHGVEESKLFGNLQHDPAALRRAEQLCRILFLGVIPALIERDYAVFGESLYEFNRQAGERFARVQGGVYASAKVAQIVETLRREGCRAVGQSSWGPAVYAICRDEQEGARIAIRARHFFPSAEILITHASNRGAVVWK